MPKRAVISVSGGLDSALAAKVIKLQGIDVLGVSFITPFTHPQVEKLAVSIDIHIKQIDISLEYLNLIKNPRFGFGKNMNPCIDCHIFMFKKAKELLLKGEADFVASGEVLGQRPMSQNASSLRRVEKESGLEGLLLRPLSAKLLPETIPEEKGWIDRNKLFDFSGRSRKPQNALAKELGLEGFGQPAGGCLLTDPGFSRRLRDLLSHEKDFSLDDVQILKLGRHFRVSAENKLVLGRSQKENERLSHFANEDYFIFEPVDTPGPTGILKTNRGSRQLLELSAGIIARYCDNHNNGVNISVVNNKTKQVIRCSALENEKLESLRIN